MKGVKLRVLPTTAFIDTFKLMGAVPTPIPFNELYTAVQTGVVDGFEHDAATVLATKLYEVCKYCWLTEHLFSPMIVVIGRRGLTKIPADLRPAVLQAAAQATAYQRGQAARKVRARSRNCNAWGLPSTRWPKAERDAVRKEMEARLWTPFAAQYPATRPLFATIAQRAPDGGR